jgi:GTP-binding protein HflX
MLIHVVDYSNPDYKKQMNVTNETLKELGVDNIPVIYAYNKIDLTDAGIPEGEEDCVYISAKKRVGIDKLVDAISRKVFTQYIHCDMLIPYDKGNIVSYLNENANIDSTEYSNDGIMISLECREADYQRYKQYASHAHS